MLAVQAFSVWRQVQAHSFQQLWDKKKAQTIKISILTVCGFFDTLSGAAG
jgi:hypothetical protein